MRKAPRRFLFAFIAASIFMILAISIGYGDAIVMPIGKIFLNILPNYGHDPRTALILILPPLLCYAVVFWAIGEILNMLAIRYRRGH
jgi:hypothetical protein